MNINVAEPLHVPAGRKSVIHRPLVPLFFFILVVQRTLVLWNILECIYFDPTRCLLSYQIGVLFEFIKSGSVLLIKSRIGS